MPSDAGRQSAQSTSLQRLRPSLQTTDLYSVHQTVHAVLVTLLPQPALDCTCITQDLIKMALSTAHTSVKAADVANARQHILPSEYDGALTTLTLTQHDPNYHQHMYHLSTKFCENLLSSFCIILLTNKQSSMKTKPLWPR